MTTVSGAWFLKQAPLQSCPVQGDEQLLGSGLVTNIRQIGVLFAIAWFLVSFVKNIEENIIESARRDGRDIDQTTVHALGRVLRITIVVTVILIALDTLGFSISGLMAAGGIGGLAVGLAAKDIIANFFGGVTVFMDRPFSVGDWILLKEQNIEGVVENIGWRQTTIRKFDKRPIYVPNAIFTTASVENPSRMTNRRIYEVIGLRYQDLEQMGAITDEVREMLSGHSEIDDANAALGIDEDVCRLEITMDDSALVPIVDGLTDLSEEIQLLAHIEIFGARVVGDGPGIGNVLEGKKRQ